MSTKQTALPEIGFIRISQILKVIPIGRSTWWAGVKAGKYPQPVKLSEHTTVWRVEDIRALIASYDKPANEEAAK